MSFPILKLNIHLIELHDLYTKRVIVVCKDKVDNDNVDMFVLSIRQIMSRYLNSFQR